MDAAHYLGARTGVLGRALQLKPLLVAHLVSKALHADEALSEHIVGPVYIFVGNEHLKLFLA